MEQGLKISVVLATFNRADTLRETLRHLQAQTLVPEHFEVLVVDDGSADHTADVVESMRPLLRFALTYLQHPNSGPGFTQNRGIRAAQAPIILLMADDIFLAPEALAAHLAAHENAAPGERAVLGRVLQSPTLTQSVFLSKWDPWRLGQVPDGQTLPYYMFWACNISLRREFMLQHGMFGQAMGRAGAAAHEDAELGYRLFQQGLRVVFSHQAWGHHHHVETLEGSLKRSRQRGLNWFDFRRKVPHPEVDVVYRAYDLGTLVKHWRALKGPRRAHLPPAEQNLSVLALRHLQRTLMFNRVTVRWLWLPLFAGAERASWLARLVHQNMYRGVIVHHFRQGCREGAQQFGNTPRPNTVAPH
jgi:glycosyltransferase involved in cell wall biosynthesis